MALNNKVGWTAQRLLDRPIVGSFSSPSIGENIQGPSVIRCPDWVDGALGKFYLYFADHKGSYIRLAFSDELAGPWTIHEPGSLQLTEPHFPTEPPPVNPNLLARAKARHARGPSRILHSIEQELCAPHIASPDVHVDHDKKRIVMYFHGLESYGYQASRVATSQDGVVFEAQKETIGKTYMRVFTYADELYALAMPGQLYHARDGFCDFEEGPVLFNPNMRHNAVMVRGDTLCVFWTQVGDTPERIYASEVDLSKPFNEWRESDPVEVLRPELEWEGANAPLEPSVRSVAYGIVNQLRDPAVLEEDGNVYLFYAGGGEAGIGVARLTERSPS